MYGGKNEGMHERKSTKITPSRNREREIEMKGPL
jgi:hypothetical protein